MSALWGKRIASVAAVVPVLCLLAAGLAGCEYADDARPSPSGAGNSKVTHPVPMASVDPELVAEQDRNMAAIEILMADVPIGAGGAAGSINGQGNGEGGLGFSTQLTDTATYTVTAGCIGAPGAKLTVSSGPGNALLDLPTSCAGVLSHDIELQPGPVSVSLVAAGEGYQKAATGVVRVYEAASLSPGPH
ncbi:hypothetical protein [Arthrobacter sp. 24S4-2]|uniref:hypothetical protein n=1 Tax=Arthrobacter sp. 24S4-2 TaxID=2575374 RepID=UPI001585DED5|nr:hypothetical protein [Arthrobacter sp. 24S4-2]